MKKILYLTLICMLLGIGLLEMHAYSFGYTNGDCGRSYMFRRGQGTLQGLAIRIDKVKLQSMKGQTINAIEFAVGSRNTNNKEIEVFITNKLGEEAITKATGTVTKANEWQMVKLTKPYQITGEEDELFVGYTASIANTYNLLTADMSKDFKGCCYIYNDGVWEDTYGLGIGGVNVRATLSGTPIYTDLILKPINIAGYLKSGTTYNIAGQVFNAGSETITAFSLGYSINQQEGEVKKYEGLNLLPGTWMDFSLPIVSNVGNADINLTLQATDVKGGSEEKDTNNNKTEASGFFYPANMEHMLLVEGFTGQGCSNCPSGHTTMHSILEKAPTKTVVVEHHAGYYPDWFTMNDDLNYTWFYGANTTSAPAIMINRSAVPLVNDYPVFNMQLGDKIEAAINYVYEQQQPYVSLQLETSYDEATRKAKVKLNITPHTNMPTAQTLFNVVLTQDSIKAQQTNGGTLYAHRHAFRGTLTGNTWGLITSLVPGNTVSWETTYELPESIASDYYTKNNVKCEYGEPYIPTDIKQMKVVAYVGAYDSENCNNNRVYNCIEAPLGESYTQGAFVSAIEEVNKEQLKPSFHLEGRRVVANNADRCEVYDLQGRRMAETVPTAGVYLVRITSQGKTVAYKVNIK